MYCSKCGNEIKNEQKFCTKCGARLIYGSAPGKKQSSVKTSATISVKDKKEDNAPVNVPRKARTHEFQINFGKTIKRLFFLFLGLCLFTMFVFACFFAFVAIIDQISLYGIVVLILMEGFILLMILFGFICMKIGSQYIYFKGRMITTKTSKGKKEYDCSDVISITCGKFRWRYQYIYYIEWIFGDQKKYRVSTGEKGFFETAGYFLDMIDGGVISPNAISAENKELLRRYEIKAWD
ncbi:MAG: zinc ribbon domain-containing protein [Lachnospiraceae bacterium]|nr:zinc ribbon domain-containing protein [Lachnospiraceae bacterium]